MPHLLKKFSKGSPLKVLKDLKENDGRELEEYLKATEDEPEEDREGLPLDDTETGVSEDVSKAIERDADTPGDNSPGLPTIATSDSLHLVDELTSMPGGLDDETAEYLVATQVASLWDAYLNDQPTDHLLSDEGGYYYNLIRSRFESEREEVENLPVPEGWSYHENGSGVLPPLLMQKRTAYQVLKKKRVGNWSGAGTGKTNSALLAIRVTESRNALVVVANATVDGWKRAIKISFPDTVIHTTPTEPSPGRYNITILNYEKFQQRDRGELARNLRDLAYDFVVLDEVQFAKQRYSEPSLRRETLEGLVQQLAKDNPDLKVLGMSATPVINNLYEGRKLLEIVQGRSFDDLDSKPTVTNAFAVHRSLMVYGFRYKPKYDIKLGKPEIVEPVRNDLIDELRNASGVLGVEQTLLPAKLEAIRPHVRKGTLVYTHYVDGMVYPIRRFLEEIRLEGKRLRVGVYTGEEKSGLDDFKEKRVDVLIGSAPVATGVDGLQEVSNRIIVLCPPWTGAEYEQLLGRVWRQGSAFDSVDIIWPQVVLDHEGDRWSWDARRKQVIDYKRTLSDCAVDGNIPKALSISPTVLLRKSREALEEWIKRLSENGFTPAERPVLEIPLPPELRQRAQVKYGDYDRIGARWSSSNSTTVYERLSANPSEWYLYHTLYRERRANWDEVPAEYIASQLRARSDLRVGDFGCGECLLRDALPDHSVHSFDYVAKNDETVTACDMAHTPLKDNSLDAAVFSLSLHMGKNWTDYLAEAHRVLQPLGYLFVAEPVKKWREGVLEQAIEDAGFRVVDTDQRGVFRYVVAVKSL
jgi:superfamily II DNA or RNA helicase